MYIGWPQGIVLVLMILGLGAIMTKSGKPKEGKESFLFAFVCDAILLGLLYWGGFFSKQ